VTKFPVVTALFIAVPLIEIYLFTVVGSAVGGLTTVILVILTAIIGVSLLRAQGMQTMARLQQQVAQGQLPANALLEGVALLFGGALLLTPGFMTDSIGFFCLIPATRKTLIQGLSRYCTQQGAFQFYQGPGYASKAKPSGRDNDVLEGEFRVKDEDNNSRF